MSILGPSGAYRRQLNTVKKKEKKERERERERESTTACVCACAHVYTRERASGAVSVSVSWTRLYASGWPIVSFPRAHLTGLPSLHCAGTPAASAGTWLLPYLGQVSAHRNDRTLNEDSKMFIARGTSVENWNGQVRVYTRGHAWRTPLGGLGRLLNLSNLTIAIVLNVSTSDWCWVELKIMAENNSFFLAALSR